MNAFENFFCNFKLTSDDAKMPTRAHNTDAGMDVYSPIDVTIPAGGSVCVDCHLETHFPLGYAMVVMEKSGRAVKAKLTLGARVIDQGYTGSIMINLFNNSKDTDFTIKKGESMAQVMLIPCWTGQPTQVEDISRESTRGDGGFGSTGLK